MPTQEVRSRDPFTNRLTITYIRDPEEEAEDRAYVAEVRRNREQDPGICDDLEAGGSHLHYHNGAT